MSQRDLVAELRGTRIVAPVHVREHVRQIVAGAATPPRRVTWRRALVLAVPAVAAIAAAVLITRPSSDHTATPPTPVERQAQSHGATAKSLGGAATATATPDAIAPAPAAGRVSRYGAFLSLRVGTADGVSSGVKRALQVATSLGGFSTSVHASTQGKAASADLTLRIPRAHVQEAITRLSALGTITGEQVDVQDLTTQLNAGDRTIARLQKQLAALRTQPESDRVRAAIAAVTAHIVRLQRQQSAIERAAHYATVQLHLETPSAALPSHHNGPLHGLGVAFHWIWIGAVYVLALGAPLFVLVGLAWFVARVVRRRRVDALLSRP
ncbi:MAG TPA: DUF4349 domain-containing protein [Gaiellaceae bacterium]|jgi:hypothetical protein|nr:DUF4349 domain-containing protein [Gaiellaceae bacterium]